MEVRQIYVNAAGFLLLVCFHFHDGEHCCRNICWNICLILKEFPTTNKQENKKRKKQTSKPHEFIV